MSTPPAPIDTITRSVAVAEARQRRRPFRPRRMLLGLAGVLTFLLIWEIASRTGLVGPTYLPPASVSVLTMFTNAGLSGFWVAVGQTITSWGLGMLLALALSVPLGVFIGLSPLLQKATRSTVEFLRPIPSVGLIPLAVLLFAVPLQQSLLIVTYGAFWQVFIQVLYGVADVDSVAMSTARSFGFTRWQRIRDVVFPTMLPYLLTGIRLAASVALILAITAELVIGTPGLGNQIALAKEAGLYASTYALVLATGLLGMIINVGVRALEHRLLGWHQSVRGEVAA
ncbi:ABC-type nitrate/sulfonate/bicarbonate transport system permease component [Homoserinimonas aerilata]|uniref:ABC-type nitrate/sulfonate/bicarbonate transport system permease component n=1 Tax=Homoserinimonas aerilata TaxID=1162970 RepID=A0A542YHF1_9MICO|nr:ABC transporter permease [Homoserinimonas aerilata]TQL47529.1 ABC-type nitrate/sulfonate/bicarbonate transport system permease component [Homoserinimonas aerilata]